VNTTTTFSVGVATGWNQVGNMYETALPLVNMDYALDTHGRRWLTGQSDIQGTVPASSAKTVPLPVTIDFVELIRLFEDVTRGSEVPYAAELGLSVKTPFESRLRLPMKKEGTLTVPRPDLLRLDRRPLRNQD
jgi:LEA14-like dessication related protein